MEPYPVQAILRCLESTNTLNILPDGRKANPCVPPDFADRRQQPVLEFKFPIGSLTVRHRLLFITTDRIATPVKSQKCRCPPKYFVFATIAPMHSLWHTHLRWSKGHRGLSATLVGEHYPRPTGFHPLGLLYYGQ